MIAAALTIPLSMVVLGTLSLNTPATFWQSPWVLGPIAFAMIVSPIALLIGIVVDAVGTRRRAPEIARLRAEIDPLKMPTVPLATDHRLGAWTVAEVSPSSIRVSRDSVRVFAARLGVLALSTIAALCAAYLVVAFFRRPVWPDRSFVAMVLLLIAVALAGGLNAFASVAVEWRASRHPSPHFDLETQRLFFPRRTRRFAADQVRDCCHVGSRVLLQIEDASPIAIAEVSSDAFAAWRAACVLDAVVMVLGDGEEQESREDAPVSEAKRALFLSDLLNTR